MSEGLKTIKEIKEKYIDIYDLFEEQFSLIEKELIEKEQLETFKKVISEVFVFGVTPIEHRLVGDSHSLVERISYNIRRNIDIKEQEVIRTFILAKCFPKEMRAFAFIQKYRINIQKCYEIFDKNNWFRGVNDTHECWDLLNENKAISEYNLPNEVYDLLLEVLK